MKKTSYFLLLFFLANACGKGPETVIVKSDPLQSANFEADTLQEDGQSFVQITIGEVNPIESLDPLFAGNNSELRMINLIYDGLVQLDENGDLSPNLARRWQVNNDSTRYVFHLNRDIRFHNSRAFSGGVGRRFTANDVRFIFERMASALVPEQTANSFSEIRGFREYQNERQFVKNPAKRVLSRISGIEVQNDSTIIFVLKNSSSDFLNKLAHPSASIYPFESIVNNQPLIQQAIGTGAFYFIKKEGNRHIFAVNQNYKGQKPKLNRLDVVSGLSERDLFQMFIRDELDLLIEPSSSILNTITDNGGNLFEGYEDNFSLNKTGIHSTYTVFFNPESGQQESVNEALSSISLDSMQNNTMITGIEISEIQENSDAADTSQTLVFSHTQLPEELFFINKFALQLTGLGFSAVLNPSYSVSEEITFSTRHFPNATPALSWQIPVFYLKQPGINGISIRQQPWNIDLTEFSGEGGQ